MISERQFSSGYSSFWKEAIPFCDALVRAINSRYVEVFADPIGSVENASLRGYTNELAFLMFREALTQGYNSSQYIRSRGRPVPSELDAEAKLRSGIPPGAVSPAALGGRPLIFEANLLASRLLTFFGSSNRSNISFFPVFQGCGRLGQCEGDLLVDGTLYEIKSGERSFRSYDIRQTIIYCALNWAELLGEALKQSGSGVVRVENICLVNPRSGLFYESGVDELAAHLGSSSAAALYDRILTFMSGEETYGS